MVYGIMGLINFAHGEVVMIGTLVTLTVAGLLLQAGVPAAAAGLGGLLAAILVCMALGWGLERVAYRPLRHAPRLTPLITAIGMSIVLQNVAMLVWGRNYLTFPAVAPKAQFELAGAHFTAVQVMIVAVSALTMVGLLFLVYRTRLGLAMRATAQNPAVAGAHYQMGFMLGLKAFTAAVLGGIGNLGGAMAGGVLLGIIEALAAGYIGDLTGGFLGSHYQDIFAFLVLIGVLMFRPAGLFGEKTGERA